jgi:hypothetical protein
MSLGFHSARLYGNHLCVWAKTGVKDLSAKGALDLLQLSLIGSPGVTDLVCHVQTCCSETVTRFILGYEHHLVDSCCIGCLLANAVLPALEVLLIEDEDRLPVDDTHRPQLEGSPIFLKPEFMVPELRLATPSW